MPNQKISELTAIATIDNATDVLPIVDTSATTTKKITLTQVKTSLALDNVDNTSDANKPVSTATQTALDAKQATLVSGTNIKTINSTSLLGSGDISISASPSGVAGAIQFSNGSAFASDANNFFWDDTNNRLGIGTNTPASPLSIVNTIALGAGSTNPRIENIAYTINNTGVQTGTATGIFLNATETALNGQTHNLMDLQVGGSSKFSVNNFGSATFAGALGVNSTLQLGGGGGSILSSTGSGIIRLTNTALTDFSRLQFGGTTSSFPAIKRNGTQIDFRLADDSAFASVAMSSISCAANLDIVGSMSLGGRALFGVNDLGSLTASAVIEGRSTTRGFLPPRMTTTQRNAISSPAEGLVIYNTTTQKLNLYTTAWEAVTSL